MKTLISAALAAILVCGSVSARSQAKADAVTAGVVAKLLFFGAVTSKRNSTPKTSANTHYALTGQGTPVRSLRQPPIPNVVIRRQTPACHGHHDCKTYKKW